MPFPEQPFTSQIEYAPSSDNVKYSNYGQYPQLSTINPSMPSTWAYIRPRPSTEIGAVQVDSLQPSALRNASLFLEPDTIENVYPERELYARGHQQIASDRKSSLNAQTFYVTGSTSSEAESSYSNVGRQQSIDYSSIGLPSMHSPYQPGPTRAPHIGREPYYEPQRSTHNRSNSAFYPDIYPGQETYHNHPLRDPGNQQPVMTSAMPKAWSRPGNYTDPGGNDSLGDDPNFTQHCGPSLTSAVGRPCITQVLNNAAVEVEDNDYYDVLSEEEDSDTQPQSSALSVDAHLSLGVLNSLYLARSNYGGARSSDGFAYPGILDHYRPERAANPLRNPVTARVFGHFIVSTGPMLSVFERRPKPGSTMFGQGFMPNSERSLWTDTLPMMALHDHGLLHAMLAVASLHISRLQGASTTPSLKHYTYSLKRVHRAVGQSKRRHEVSTLAATLLLGFYEIMTADHPKWSTHLCGASKLIHEIDFAEMTKRLGILKARTNSEAFQSFGITQGFAPNSETGPSESREPVIHRMPELDVHLVGDLMGRHLRYDEYGFVVDSVSGPTPERAFTIEELNNYEVLQDLYWWYCKQDMVHAIIGGNALLLNFERWADCPPRAPIGLEDAVYGTFDHLLLLLGRIADFIIKDRGRKVKASAVTSGHGVRSNTTSIKPTQKYTNVPQQSKSVSGRGSRGHPAHEVQPNTHHRDVSGMPPQPVPFYGMAPSSGAACMPRAFGLREAKAASPDLDVNDIEGATAQALEEWNEILAACKTFADRLGPTFQPRTDAQSQSFMTPFGQAILYKEYDIGLVWLLYYMTLIIATRCHPSMPPAATMAVGLAARETAHYANTVGRIAAGITFTAANSPLNASIGGAYADCTMPLFFAGVQYREPEQRAWTITRLHEIEQKSGWASAGLCANGCETAWCRAAEMGRGPPYERVSRDMNSEKSRLSGERLNMREDEPISAYKGRVVPSNGVGQMTWAIGLLGTEVDLQNMSLGKNEAGI